MAKWLQVSTIAPQARRLAQTATRRLHQSLTRRLRCESGAVTVDFVVLTALVLTLSGAATYMIGRGMGDSSSEIATSAETLVLHHLQKAEGN